MQFPLKSGSVSRNNGSLLKAKFSKKETKRHNDCMKHNADALSDGKQCNE